MKSEARYRPVPLHRRWINDIIHFGKKSHVMGVSWQINIAPVLAARAARQPAVGWAAIWIKALALVSVRRPELRTAYLPFPWARLYVHPHCICSVAIDRTWREVSAVFFEQFVRPEQKSLAALDAALRSLKQVPVESVGSFRRLIRFARPPVPVRRLIWSLTLNWFGPPRAKYIGTCGVNPFPTGGTIHQSAMPVSFMLYFGLVKPNGDAQLQVFYDHRVADGIEVFRIVRDIEAALNRDIAGELGAPPASSETPPLVASIGK